MGWESVLVLCKNGGERLGGTAGYGKFAILKTIYEQQKQILINFDQLVISMYLNLF